MASKVELALRMNSYDVSGYLQIAIGIVGIVLTLVNVQKLVPDIEQFTKGTGAPPELDNLSGFFRVCIVLTLLLLMLFLIAFGFSVVLSEAYKGLGAKYPQLSAAMTVAALLSLSVSLSLAAYRNSYWISGIVGTLGAGLGAVISAVNPDIGTYWTVATLFTIAFLVSGAFTVAARSGVFLE